MSRSSVVHGEERSFMDAHIEYEEMALAALPSYNFPSLGESIESSDYRQYLKEIVQVYGLDRPCAIVDLGRNVWAYTTGALCPPCALARSTEAGFRRCSESDEVAAKRAYQSGGVGLYRCACLGLIDMVVPIKSTDRDSVPEVAAALLVGQYRCAWHNDLSKAHVRQQVGDRELAQEIAHCLPGVRWLEAEIDGICQRLRRLGEFIHSTTAERNGNPHSRRCHIAQEDIESLRSLMQMAVDHRQSISRMLNERKPLLCCESAPLQWIGGAWSEHRAEQARARVAFWNWDPANNWQGSQHQHWYLPSSPVASQAPFACSHRILQEYAEKQLSTETMLLCDSNWNRAKTVRSLSSHSRIPQTAFVGLAWHLPNGNPQHIHHLIVEGHWREMPSKVNLDEFRDACSSMGDGFTFLEETAALPLAWQPIQQEIASALRQTSGLRESALSLLDSREFGKMLAEADIDEYARSCLAMTIELLTHARPQRKLSPSDEEELWRLLFWVFYLPSWSARAVGAYSGMLSGVGVHRLNLRFSPTIERID